MFDFVREKRRVVQVVLLLIILPFAFFGVDTYRQSGDGNAPATVNGSKITQQEFQTALRQQQDRMRQMLGENFDPAMFDTVEMRNAVLNNLVSQRLLIEQAKSAGLAVTDEQVAQVIAGIDAFKENGSFNQARYVSALSQQNMSPLMFEAKVRDELVGQQMRSAYAENGYSSDVVTDNIISINEQRRRVSIAHVSPQSFMAQAKVDDAEIKAYYDQNQKEFQLPEQVKVEYVTLSIDDLMSKADVSSEEVRKLYEERKSEFASAEQRHAAHILITVEASAPQAVQDAAKAKAETLLKQVRENPSKFAELAKNNSEDPGSAQNGGDLGLFSRGMMVKPFDDVVFSLKPGEISNVVKTDYGYHIIKLIDVKSSNPKSFEEVSGEIMARLRQQKASDAFAELAEKFNNAVYEQSDTLKAAADLIGVEVVQGGWITKGDAPSGIWTPKLLQAVFGDDAVKNKRNTAATEVAPNKLVSARVIEYKPAAAKLLADVRDSIKQSIIYKKSLDMAVKQGTMLLGQMQQGGNAVVDWKVAQEITHAQHGALDAEIVRQVFQADKNKLPQYVGAEAQHDGFVIVRVEAVMDGEKPDEVKRSRYAKQLRQMMGEEVFQAYLKDAKQQAKIKLNLPEKSTEKP